MNEWSTLNLSDECQRVTCGQTCTKVRRQKCSRRRTQSRPVQEPRSEWHQGNISYRLFPTREKRGRSGRIAVRPQGPIQIDLSYMTSPNRLVVLRCTMPIQKLLYVIVNKGSLIITERRRRRHREQMLAGTNKHLYFFGEYQGYVFPFHQ